MIEDQIVEKVIMMTPAELIVYLLLAGIVGWAIRAMSRKKWWHRFWEHESRVNQPTPVTLQRDSSPLPLNLIQGLDTHAESIMNANGIYTLMDLTQFSARTLSDMLNRNESTQGLYDTTTWPHQAHLAIQRRWKELDSYQQFLRGRT